MSAQSPWHGGTVAVDRVVARINPRPQKTVAMRFTTSMIADTLSPWKVEISVSREQEWIAAWGRAGREMEALRRRQLSNLEVVSESVLDSLFELGLRCGQRRRTSGLVEQQRIFRRARR